jgi:hypothetical protein
MSEEVFKKFDDVDRGKIFSKVNHNLENIPSIT